jgi:hypothetical protein
MVRRDLRCEVTESSVNNVFVGCLLIRTSELHQRVLCDDPHSIRTSLSRRLPIQTSRSSLPRNNVLDNPVSAGGRVTCHFVARLATRSLRLLQMTNVNKRIPTKIIFGSHQTRELISSGLSRSRRATTSKATINPPMTDDIVSPT